MTLPIGSLVVMSPAGKKALCSDDWFVSAVVLSEVKVTGCCDLLISTESYGGIHREGCITDYHYRWLEKRFEHTKLYVPRELLEGFEDE